jgi:hypothetical protein
MSHAKQEAEQQKGEDVGGGLRQSTEIVIDGPCGSRSAMQR